MDKEIPVKYVEEKYKKIIKFDDSTDLNKHEWTYYPRNNTERTWAKHAREGFINWTGSSYYESFGPYY